MRFFILLISFLTFVGCSSLPLESVSDPSPQVSLEKAPDVVEVAATLTADQYRLGAGDRLRVIVFDEEELSGEFVVDGVGLVSMPLIGEIPATGKTVREFQRAVEVALKDGYLNDPKVSAEVLNFRPYYILGEVGKPGTYPFRDGLTVMNAVATAEGFTYRANKKVVMVRHADGDGEKAYELTSTTPVRPGDTIRIRERLF